MMQRTPADERLDIVMSIVFELGAGEPVDIMFECVQIGGRELCVWSPVVRPVVVWVLSDHF